MKPIIVANWKCNPVTLKEAEELFELTSKGEGVIVCPPFVYLASLKANGAQDIFFEEKGPYTGEISSLMIKDLGCKYVIVGHSERRKYFNETDEIVNKKLKAALTAGLIPIFCIGEAEKERKENKTEEVIKRQLENGLSGIDGLKLIIAYEPVWAIGTGNSCDVKEAEKMNLFIKSQISQGIPILYGGSVNSSNSRGYIKEAKMNGLLVGGASLNADEFIKIAESAA